jgi:drug efflux transport system permease protein
MTHTSPLSRSRLLAISRKELLQLRRDTRSLGLAFALPALLLLLFGYVITTDVRNISAAVLDRNRTPESRALIAAFSQSGYFTVTTSPTTESQAASLIERGKVRVAVVIPERFSADLVAGRPAPVELLLDGSDAKTATVARGYADAIARSFSANTQLNERRVAAPLRAESRVWYNEALESQPVVVPGLIGLIMSIIAAMLTSLTIAREWERGTMEQLAATPVHRAEVIVGKLLPYLAIALIDVAVAVVVGVFVFGVPFRGSVLLFALAATIFLVGVLGLGIMLSSAVKSQLLATQAAIFATYLPALLFSGFLYPIDSMPLVLRIVSRAVPARHFVSLSRDILLKGVGAEAIVPTLAGLTIYATVMLSQSIRIFKKEVA